MNSSLTTGVHAFDCTNRIKWCYTLMSAKQVNNEDLDHQLRPQTFTGLLTPLEPIDQGFHAGSAQLHGMINCIVQIPSYHLGSFVKVSSYNEKLHLCVNVSADLRHCVLVFTLLFCLVARRNKHTCQKQKITVWWVPLCVILHYFPHAFLFPLHSHHQWHSGEPMGDACRYLLWLNNCTPAKSESSQ